MYTKEKIEICNGVIYKRNNADGRTAKADKKRDAIAQKLHVEYLGVRKVPTGDTPNQYNNYVLLGLKNGNVLEMTMPAFENKSKVNNGKMKRNCSAELFISAFLEKHGIHFMREATIKGFTLSKQYANLKNELSEEDNEFLGSFTRSIKDFIIFPKNATEPTKLLAVDGSMHNALYDAHWEKFAESGLASRLGFSCHVIDTSSYASTKNNDEANESILRQLCEILNLPYDGEFMEQYKAILDEKEAELHSKSHKEEQLSEIMKNLMKFCDKEEIDLQKIVKSLKKKR